MSPLAPSTLLRLLGQPSGWMRLLLTVLLTLSVTAGAVMAALLTLLLLPALLLGMRSHRPLRMSRHTRRGARGPGLATALTPRERGV